MIEIEETASAVVTAVLASLPVPVQTSLMAALSRLLGGFAAYPAAWLRRPTQAVEDITDVRSLVSKGLAQAVVEHTKADSAIMQAALEIYLPSIVTKARNRAAVAMIAIEQIAQTGTDPGDSAPPEEDWINAFMRYSEDASSERLQQLFGKILAGQIINPGAFSTATLRAISELDQSVAVDFSWLWEQSIGEDVLKTNQFGPGEGWMKLVRLKDAGLVSPQDAGIYQPTTSIEYRLPSGEIIKLFPWSIGANGVFLNVIMRKTIGHRLDVVNLTRSGLELTKLLPPPNLSRNLLAIAPRLQNNEACAWIDLIETGVVTRVWSSAQLFIQA